MQPRVLTAAFGAALALGSALSVSRAGSAERMVSRFEVRHEAVVRELPAGAKKARIWLVVPREDSAQRTGEIRLAGPGSGSVREGGTYENRFAYFEVADPVGELRVSAEFTVERREVSSVPSPAVVEPLNTRDQKFYRLELDPNRHVPVGGKWLKLAREIVGRETNTVLQARKLYDWVLGHVEYWVKDPKTLKASPNGESEYCLASKTGNCSDFHSLYASLARSLGIPVRMVYGTVFQGENTPVPGRSSLDGKDADAGFHCWVEFLAKGHGWVPLDVAYADLVPPGPQQEYYFGNLDARRVTWTYGRDLELAPKQDGEPVNSMSKVYVEIDGKPHTAWERKLTFRTAPG